MILSSKILTIAMTRASGKVAYAFLFQLLSTASSQEHQRIRLRLHETEPFWKALEGLEMELKDSLFPNLDSIFISQNLQEVFSGADWCLFFGGFHQRRPMTHKDFILKNAKLIREQAMALNSVGSDMTQVLMIANPCNTNCLLLSHYAPRVSSKNIFGLSLLDQYRGIQFLAENQNVHWRAIQGLYAWGNHSATVFPDFENVSIEGRPLFLPKSEGSSQLEEMVQKVQARGAQIIRSRKHNSEGSAAKATLDGFVFLERKDENEKPMSMVVASNGEYGVRKGIWFSYPVIWRQGQLETLNEVTLSASAKEQIFKSEVEINWERQTLIDEGLLPRESQ